MTVEAVGEVRAMVGSLSPAALMAQVPKPSVRDRWPHEQVEGPCPHGAPRSYVETDGKEMTG